MKLHISAISDVGCVRKQNEDMVLINRTIFRDSNHSVVIDLNEREVCFMAVADGIGGHQAGEVASLLTLQEIDKKISNLLPKLNKIDIKENFSLWTNEINDYIRDEGNKVSNRNNMGTTLVGILFYYGDIYFINVGDSRLYHYFAGKLQQLTRDHTLREFTGNPTIPSNIIVNSFGGDDTVFCDFGEVSILKTTGNTLLLCSDGLSDMLSDAEIEKILSKSDPIPKLVDAAKQKGGKDNITIIMASIEED